MRLLYGMKNYTLLVCVAALSFVAFATPQGAPPARPLTGQGSGGDGETTVILRSNERYEIGPFEKLIAKEIFKGDKIDLNILNPGVTFLYQKFPSNKSTEWTLLFQNLIIGNWGNYPYIYSSMSWNYGPEFLGPGLITMQEFDASGNPMERNRSDTIVFVSVPYIP